MQSDMSFLIKLKGKAKALKTELVAIYLSMKDNRTPFLAKFMILLTISYAFSPIDLIPDFIPVLGYLDDLIILPLMIALSIKLIPKEVINECRAKAKQDICINKRLGLYSAVLIILIWSTMILMIFFRNGIL